MKHQSDPNACCPGHITDGRPHPRIAAFPDNFVTEAAALGGKITMNAGGCTNVDYLFDNPAELRRLPALDEQMPVKWVLARIAEAETICLLKANAPYSILASLVEPARFYRWLKKNPDDIHAGLERITAGLCAYINKAQLSGVRILSLADPYANPDILGEKHYRIFAGHWLVQLLSGLRDSHPLVIHLCPQSSLTMERWGLLKSETIPLGGKQGAYIDILAGLDASSGMPILGHQCIYAETPTEMIVLSIDPGGFMGLGDIEKSKKSNFFCKIT